MCNEIVDYFEVVIQRKSEILELAMTRKIVNDEKLNINIELMLLSCCKRQNVNEHNDVKLIIIIMNE